jgi:hypothetical protein
VINDVTLQTLCYASQVKTSEFGWKSWAQESQGRFEVLRKNGKVTLSLSIKFTLIKAFNSYSSLTSVDTHNDNAQYKYGTYLN